VISKGLIIGGMLTATAVAGAGVGTYAIFGGTSRPNIPTVVKGETIVAVATPGKGNGSGNGAPPATMTISGSVSGYLFPGRSMSLVLTISNPNAFGASISSVTATPSSPTAGCPGTSLAATSYSGSLPISGHGTASVTLLVSMSKTAPNVCQHTTYSLTYAAEAHQG
jgi:hypothetical protein